MDFPSEISDFLIQTNFAVLSTIKKDGSTQMSVMWYEFDGRVFRLSTITHRAKYKNIKKDPRVTVLVLNQKNPYRYVSISGRVTDITRKGGHDFIDSLAKRYLNEEKFSNDPERKEDRVILTITPQSYTGWGWEYNKKVKGGN